MVNMLLPCSFVLCVVYYCMKMNILRRTRAMIEMHHFFLGILKFGAQQASREPMWREIHQLPDENSDGLGTQRESCKQMAYFRWIFLQEPGHSDTISDEKCYLDRGTRRRVNTWKHFRSVQCSVSPSQIRTFSLDASRRCWILLSESDTCILSC